MMPVTVHRTWDGHEGTITWWIDDAFDERTRLKEKRQPPNALAWSHQMHKMRVFAALVGDSDRNLGNVLITEDWKLWMIDFTRAFRLWPDLKRPHVASHVGATALHGRRGALWGSIAADGRFLYFIWSEDVGDLWVMDLVQSGRSDARGVVSTAAP